jgi:hypothetical protein
MGLALPPRGSVVHLAVFATQAPGRDPTVVTFLRLQPASEFDPETLAPDAPALPRFFAPSAPPNHRDPPTPRPFLPGSRCALTLTMRLGALLPRRSPWCVSTRRAHGVRPSELDLTETAVTSRCSLPSCDSPCRDLASCCGRCERSEDRRGFASGVDLCRLRPPWRGLAACRRPGSLGFPLGFPLPLRPVSKALRHPLEATTQLPSSSSQARARAKSRHSTGPLAR